MYRLALLLALWPGLALADDVAVLIDDARPGTYLLTVNADKSVSVNPIRVVRLGNSPAPAPVPDPGNPTAFELEVERQAKAALAAGGSLTTGAAFSEVYSLVSAGIVDGSLDHKRSLEAANMATKHVLSKSADAAKWTAFELHVRNALQVLDSQGAFKTKADYAAALKSVANGLNRATGHKNVGKALLSVDLSTQGKVWSAHETFGILDNIDLVKLMEFIRFLLELFKLFAPK